VQTIRSTNWSIRHGSCTFSEVVHSDSHARDNLVLQLCSNMQLFLDSTRFANLYNPGYNQLYLHHDPFHAATTRKRANQGEVKATTERCSMCGTCSCDRCTASLSHRPQLLGRCSPWRCSECKSHLLLLCIPMWRIPACSQDHLPNRLGSSPSLALSRNQLALRTLRTARIACAL